MGVFVWPAEDGWPYPDGDDDQIDLNADVDDDLLSVRALSEHLFDGLGALEREVVDARFGLEGHEVRSMRQLHHELGVPRSDLRHALGSGLAKIRTHLS